MEDDDNYLMVSGIQHFKFCKRQWALIHIEQQWSENYSTATGRLLHERTDSGIKEIRGDIITNRSMRVISHELKIQGVCDVVEFKKSRDGININGLEGLHLVYPIEYKKGKPKTDTIDHVQLTAQAMCLEEMLCTTINYGYMFYKETKRRQKVEFTKELKNEVKELVLEMKQYYDRAYTPKVKKRTVCKSCSLVDICMPMLEKTKSVAKYIEERIGGM